MKIWLHFGLNSSPFILNYIIKFHANKFKNNFCTELLKYKFYIDNFIATSNSPKELLHIYKKVINEWKWVSLS